MIVYVKGQSGNVYASPVFAVISKGWKEKSVVLNELGNGLFLLPSLNIGLNKIAYSNYFHIDDSLQKGWIKKRTVSGFDEIINNKKLLKDLKHGKIVPLDGLEVVNLYNLPLPVITEFEIKTEQDISTFDTVCWGLHDAVIEKINKVNNDIIINFDTTWEKHIIITFHNVIDQKNYDDLACILASYFEIENGCTKWKIHEGFDLSWNELKENNAYILAEAVTWQLLID